MRNLELSDNVARVSGNDTEAQDEKEAADIFISACVEISTYDLRNKA